MAEWYSATQAIQTVEVEICFLLKSDYNGMSLPLPAIPRQEESLIRTSELVSHEVLLAPYYQQVLKHAKNEETPFSEIAHYFWLRLFLWNTDAGIHISFPWYDTYSEMKPLLEKVLSNASGELFWDRDQSWEINIEMHERRIYVREWDPDDEKFHTLVNFPKSVLEALVTPLMDRTKKTIDELSRLLGADVWTSRIEEPNFHLLRRQPRNSWWKWTNKI